MNAIAQQLGEVGLPAPVAELASRRWDVVVVGGGHNGLTAAAYLASAGKSVLVLERRERLGGACTLERPFSDPEYVVSPCAYVVGLLDELVIRELGLKQRGLHFDVADPNLWVPFDDGTSFGQWLDDDRTNADLKAMGLSAKDVEGYWAYEHLFDEIRRRLRTGERDTWVGESPTRAEIEELLKGEQTMIDVVFTASMAEVLDDHIGDQRLKDALFGQGIIGAWAGPKDAGTASIKLMHFQGDLEGQGPVWGYVRGGMGMVSFAIADAAQEAGATLAAGVPVSEILPERGRRARGRHADRGRHGHLQRRPQAPAQPRQRPPERVRAAAHRLEDPQPRREVQRLAHPPADVDRRARPGLPGPRDGRRHHRPRRRPAGLRALHARRGGRRLRRDLRPDRLRPDARPARQAPDERVRPVRAVRVRLGPAAATRSPGSSST